MDSLLYDNGSRLERVKTKKNIWQNSLERNGFAGSILMNLTKAYDCLTHDIFLAKLPAHGFSEKSTTLFLSYLTNRAQSIQIGSTVSDWTNIVIGIPQSSIMGSLKLNFKEHVNNIVKKAYYKLSAFGRLRKFLTLEKSEMLNCSMIESPIAH